MPGNTVMNMSLGTRSNSPELDTSGVSSVGTGDISDAMLMDFMVSAATVLRKSPAFVIKRCVLCFYQTNLTIHFVFLRSLGCFLWLLFSASPSVRDAFERITTHNF